MSRRNAQGGGLPIKKSVLLMAAAAALPTLMPGWAKGQAPLTWDNNGNIAPNPQDGPGTWDTTLLNWWDGSSNVAWNNANYDTAVFGAGGIGGAVTLSTTMNVGGLRFDSAGYTLTGGALNVSGATAITANQAGTIGTAIGGAGPVSFSVASGVMLSITTVATHSFSGGATVGGGGTLNLGVSTTTWSLGTGSIVLGDGARIRWGNAANLINAMDVPALNTATLVQAGNGTFSGALTGSGTLVGSTASVGSVLSVGGANSAFSGTFMTGSNMVRFTTTTAGSPNAVWVAAGGGSFGCRLGSGTVQLGALLGASNTMLRGSTGTGTAPVIYEIGGISSIDSQFLGTIIDGDSSARRAGISKVGANNRLLLGGTNTYTGDTYVNAGTLLVNGTHNGGAAGYAVAPGATLGGTGVINLTTGVVTISGRLAPGESPGTLDIDNVLTFAGDSLFSVELGGSLPGDGSGFYDQVNMTDAAGAVNIGTNVTLNVSLFGGFIPAGWDLFYILTRADSAEFTNTFAGLPEGAPVALGGGHTGFITYRANWIGTQAGSSLHGGNDVAIYIPEPAGLSVLGLAGFVTLVRRRRLA